MSSSATIVWFRLDLRLADNPCLLAAAERGGAVIPVFIWAPEEEGAWPPGAASRWWLHHSLASLDRDLAARGSRLILRRGPSLSALESLAAETGAGAVFWSRRYEPAVLSRDREAENALRNDGLAARSFNSSLLFEPWTVRSKSGNPFRVFSAFWRACRSMDAPRPPASAPARLPAPPRRPESIRLSEFELESAASEAGALRQAWQPGEQGALSRLNRFLDESLGSYPEMRDRPDRRGTSRLSPHLHFGEIGPRQVWHAVCARATAPRTGNAVEAYLRQIGWREFAYHLLFHQPHTPEQPLRPEFAGFPWRRNLGLLESWREGRTGCPIVDAAMRELSHTGWMHNRLRMVVASFLVKDLLIEWREGAAWFWDRLVDADLANNTLGWQWTAGCGADAAPFFRIFNPVSQAEKFDPNGDYVRRWVHEVAPLPAAWIHKPFQAPAAVLARAGIELGKTYPRPIVDHRAAARDALAAFAGIKSPKRDPARV